MPAWSTASTTLGGSWPGPTAIGLDHVLSVLDALMLERGEERYRAAPLLRQLGWSGRLGEQTGAGFFSYEE